MLEHYDGMDATTKQGKSDWIQRAIEGIVLGARPPQKEMTEGKFKKAQLGLLKYVSEAGTTALLDQDVVDDSDITLESYKKFTYGVSGLSEQLGPVSADAKVALSFVLDDDATKADILGR